MTAEENCFDIAPSSAMLTEDQQRFLDDCEAQFAGRYTEEDPEYVRELKAGMSTPPIVDPWYNKPRRNFDWSRQQGRRHQNWGGRNERHNEGGGYQHHRQTDKYQQRHRPY